MKLRPTEPADLDDLFRIGNEPEGIWMAAFTPAQPTDRKAYDAKWAKILADPTILNLTIVDHEAIVGSIATFEIEGDRELTYWISRSEWGKGIASRALVELLEIELVRPLFGRAAADNAASRRVLEKAGFHLVGTERGFANARATEIEEVVYRLD